METIKEKFQNLIMKDLPEHFQFEFSLIKKETDDFEDEDLVDIYRANFEYFYLKVRNDYPASLHDYIPPFEEPEELEPEFTQEQIEKAVKAKERAQKYLVGAKDAPPIVDKSLASKSRAEKYLKKK